MKADRRKQQIMDTALKLFARKGYHETTVADIIDDIGVARGTFYRYFEDKRDLFSQLLAANFRYVKRVLPKIPEEGPVTAAGFEALLTRAFLELLGRPNSRDFMTMMVAEAAGADVYFARQMNEFYDGIAQTFAGYVARLQDEGVIVRRNPHIMAYMILGALREIFVQWAQGNKFADLEALIHDAAAFIVSGVGTGSREAGD